MYQPVTVIQHVLTPNSSNKPQPIWRSVYPSCISFTRARLHSQVSLLTNISHIGAYCDFWTVINILKRSQP